MIHLIPFINEFASAWAGAMFRAAWQGAVGLALAWLICRLIPKLPARIRCWIWRAAYLKLLIALVWATPINLPLLRAKPAVRAENVSTVDHPIVRSSPIIDAASSRDVMPARLTIVEVPPVSGTLPPAILAPPPRLSILAAVLGIWIFGLLLGCVKVCMEWRSAIRLLRTAEPIVDEQLLQRLAILAKRMGLPRPPPILCSNEVPCPLLTGHFRPTIILPRSVLQRCAISQIQIAVAHEMAHLRRHDLFWCWLSRVGQILFFFHPLVILTQRDWREAQESACDEAALASVGLHPAEYGEALIQIISMSSFTRRPALALGIADSRKNIERRLLAMKHFTSTFPHPWALGAATVCALVIGFVPFRVTAQTPRDKIEQLGRPSSQPSRPTDPGPVRREPEVIEPTIEDFARVDPKMSAYSRTLSEMEIYAKNSEVRGENHPSSVMARKKLDDLRDTMEVYRKELNDKYAIVYDANGPHMLARREKPWPRQALVEGVSVKIAAGITGVIRENHCRNGQMVKKGELLIQLDDEEVQTRLESAKADLELATTMSIRAEKAHEKGVMGIDDVETARSNVHKAQSAFKLAQLGVLRARINSPIDGVIVNADRAVEGQSVQAGEQIAVVLNADTLTVRIPVAADSTSMINVGQKVVVSWGKTPEEHAEGVISFISPQVDSSIGTVIVEALVQNAQHKLRSGTTVTVSDVPEK